MEDILKQIRAEMDNRKNTPPTLSEDPLIAQREAGFHEGVVSGLAHAHRLIAEALSTNKGPTNG